MIVQPTVPNNSSSVPKNINDVGRPRNKEIVALAAVKTEDTEKPPVDSGYGKDVKGIFIYPTILLYNINMELLNFQIYRTQCCVWS